LALSAGLAGCSGSGGAGATTGGAQDNALAQAQISKGLVPKPEAFTVEGLLNQYDLPLESQACSLDLCIDAGYGISPVLVQDRSAVFVQIGFSSGIDPATFRRAPQNLSVVVDRSGSMSGTKLSSVKQALTRLIDQLGPSDRLSIVLFDDLVDVLVQPTLVTNPAALRSAVNTIAARNLTNMAAGLREGTTLVQANAGQPGISDRIMVFTDANTNTGDTDQSTFIQIVQANAQQNIGLTLFGVGTDLNQALVLAITDLRGGNYFFLKDATAIATVFDQDFDYLVTPLGYDLQFTLVPATGFAITAVYGFPSYYAGGATVELTIPTVFLSRNHGAIVVRLEPTGGAWPPLGQSPLADLAMTYSPANGGAPVTQTLQAAYTGTSPLANDTIFYSQQAVRKAVALVNEALAEEEASTYYYQTGGTDVALALLERTRAMLVAEAAALNNDPDLTTEAGIVARLASNMRNGAGPPSAYGEEGAPMACSFAAGAGGHHALPLGIALLALLALLGRRRNG
jgi:Ca-activated chloride channel family protein